MQTQSLWQTVLILNKVVFLKGSTIFLLVFRQKARAKHVDLEQTGFKGAV